MSAKSGDLLSRREAAQVLGVTEGEVDAAVQAGSIREVWRRETPEAALLPFLVGADIDALLPAQQGPSGAVNAWIRGEADKRCIRSKTSAGINADIRRALGRHELKEGDE